MDIEDLRVPIHSTSEINCVRKDRISPTRKRIFGFADEDVKIPTEEEIVSESRRCLYCYEAPCNKCCASNVNVREFVHAASCRNWYYGAKVLLTSNPLPLSTANLCPTYSLCQGGCNLNKTSAGSIKTHLIQKFVMRKFIDLYNNGVKQTFSIPSNGKKVCIVGAGPSGLSCAAFLRRLGFEVVIYEKDGFAGGLLVKQLLPNRLPQSDIDFEVKMLVDIGVTFQFNKELGKDFTIESLQTEEKFDAVFLAIGRPEELQPDFPCKGAVSSADFLYSVNKVMKLKHPESELPDIKGKKVLVLGAGDTAIDCASAASRLGACQVTVAFRKDFKGMRADPRLVEELLEQEVEFLPLMAPTAIDNGTVTFRLQERKTVFHQSEQPNAQTKLNCSEQYVALDEYVTRKYDMVILAFGSTIGSETKKKVPVIEQIRNLTKEKSNNSSNNSNGDKSIYDHVFAGGDLMNSQTVIEAVNDGKFAARKIADSFGIYTQMPIFESEVDNVSLETTVCGMKFVNPFGISSAPLSGSYELIRNSFVAGFGYAVTKSILMTKDVQRENDMRIVRCDDSTSSSNSCGSFVNTCIMTDHPLEYWVQTIRRLKTEWPDRIIIASIGAQDSESDWQTLVRTLDVEGGADAFELNLSCPNEVHGEGGAAGGFHSVNKIGMALGTDPKSVTRITSYCCKATKKPVFPKLTPNVTNIAHIAEAAMEGGAAGISTINTVSGIAKFFRDGTPLPQVGKEKLVISGGLSGEMVRPIALRDIAMIHKKNKDIPILGIGGIWNADTAMQHLYAGANVFQICSGVQKYSFEIVQEMKAGLQFILFSWSKKGLRNLLSTSSEEKQMMPYPLPIDENEDGKVPKIEELRGIGTRKVVEREAFDQRWTIVAQIEQNICLQCGKCALSCRDNSTNAIYMSSESGVWKVDPSKCVGCALCTSVCPVNAIRLKEAPYREIPTEKQHKKKGCCCCDDDF